MVRTEERDKGRTWRLRSEVIDRLNSVKGFFNSMGNVVNMSLTGMTDGRGENGHRARNIQVPENQP